MERLNGMPRGRIVVVRRLAALAVVLALVVTVAPSDAQEGTRYPPLSEYLMPEAQEIALARSAAPAAISDRATINILTESGYDVAAEGDNGFACMVMRGWTAPTYTPTELRELVYEPSIVAPICFDPVASQNVMPYYELRSELAMAGMTPDEIAAGIEAAYATGELPARAAVSFAYMWSAAQNLGPDAGAWHPHVMVFAPYYENAMLGGNEFGSPLPQVGDDAGTPFTVVLIPVDHDLAIPTVAEDA